MVGVEVAGGAGFDLGDDVVDFAFGALKDGFALGTVATLEHGGVGVGHQYREVSVDRAAQGFLEEPSRIIKGQKCYNYVKDRFILES